MANKIEQIVFLAIISALTADATYSRNARGLLDIVTPFVPKIVSKALGTVEGVAFSFLGKQENKKCYYYWGYGFSGPDSFFPEKWNNEKFDADEEGGVINAASDAFGFFAGAPFMAIQSEESKSQLCKTYGMGYDKQQPGYPNKPGTCPGSPYCTPEDIAIAQGGHTGGQTTVTQGRPGPPQYQVIPGQPGSTQYEVHPGQPGSTEYHVIPGQPGSTQYQVIPGQSGSTQYQVIPGQSGSTQYQVHPGQPGSTQYQVIPGEPGSTQYQVIPGQPGSTLYEVIPGQPGTYTTETQTQYQVIPGSQQTQVISCPPCACPR